MSPGVAQIINDINANTCVEISMTVNLGCVWGAGFPN
jgi:hypothetical protein